MISATSITRAGRGRRNTASYNRNQMAAIQNRDRQRVHQANNHIEEDHQLQDLQGLNGSFGDVLGDADEAFQLADGTSAEIT